MDRRADISFVFRSFHPNGIIFQVKTPLKETNCFLIAVNNKFAFLIKIAFLIFIIFLMSSDILLPSPEIILPSRLYIGGLSDSITKDEISSRFASFAIVNNIEIVKSSLTGISC